MSAGKSGSGPRAERHSSAKEDPEPNKTNVGGEAANEPDELDQAEISEPAGASEGEAADLRKLLDEARAETAAFRDEAARAKADFYNYRTRIERDRARDRILAAEGTVDALIPVMDNLDRTLQAVTDKESPIYKGVSMVQRQFFGVLRGLGLEVIDTDCPFDPSLHEAVMMVDIEDGEDGRILEELDKGYRLGEKVLRAARVKIAKLR
ncbi:MAG: nucleotide exchange factor GrpE [Synergistaceae bacterium]|jgi:molecular chaperone GrpE|nr:nucleotide exchange factor GrpE [Synergistaceae bacterium]